MFKKMFEVISAKPGGRRKQYDTGKRNVGFGGSSKFFVTDPGEAAELNAKYGGTQKSESDDLRVIPIDDMPTENGHRYTFSTRNMPECKKKGCRQVFPNPDTGYCEEHEK